jgi:hypothetical protein
MKKLFNYAIVLLAGLTVALSCSKIEKEIDNPVVEPETEVVSIPVTVMATLPDVDTKVAFEATFDAASKPTAMKRTWEASDKLRVIDSTNPSMYEDLDLESGDGTPTAVFHGNLKFTASSYNVQVLEDKAAVTNYSVQTQAKNDDTAHLHFVASASGVTDLTAAITLSETSGVLGVIAKLPAAATEIESVEFVEISSNTTVLKINLTNPAVSDQVLKLYANMQAGMTINSGAYFIRFNAPSSAEHKIYTRYYELANPVAFATHTGGVGEYRTLKLNCVNTDKYAGGSDNGSATAPYLIADGYQLAAINSYASTSETTYFKMIDNVDMTGITHTPINEGVSGYSISVNFDGNNKTISNLGKNLFYVFKGSIKDLTLDNSNVTNRGIFADYCQGSGHTITNVNITNGKVTSSSSNVGALIGQINNGTGTCATITNCSVTDTDVTGGGVVGGVIGYANTVVSINGCSYSGGTVTASAKFAGGLIGSAGNYASTFTDCHVSNITVTSSADRVGGLAGQTEKLTAVNNCSSTNAIVTGTINLGGLLGILYGSAADCTSAGGSITSTNTTSNADIGLGGLAGWLQYGVISNCSSSVSINQTTNGRDIGGLVGKMVDGTIEKSYATGDVSGIQRNVGGLVGLVTLTSSTATISNCYCTGIVAANSYGGGLIGYHEKGDLTVTNCYSTSAVTGGFAMGGLIGIANNVAANVSKSVAWNPSVTAVSIEAANWSSGAVVGVAHPNCTLTDNYRNPSMAITAYWGNQTGYTVELAAGYSQPNVSGTTHPLTDSTGTEMTDTGTANNAANPHYPIFPYHGKVEAGKTLSVLAETTLGWDSTVWDFSADLPTLK